MQSLPTAKPNVQENATVEQKQNRKRVWSIYFSIVLLCTVCTWYYLTFVYARPISSFAQLKSNVGNRVTFTATANLRDYKAYELVYLDGEAIWFSHKLGSIEWSPEAGEKCRVVGVVEQNKGFYGPPYGLTDAECFRLK